MHSQHISPPISSQEMLTDLDRIYGADQRLVSGNFYHEVSLKAVNGHPFCIDEEWKTGNVILADRIYYNLLLKYDISSNNLVLNTINLNNSAITLCLKIEKISEFTLGNKWYIRYPGNDKKDKILFCEVLTEGKVNYLLLRSKQRVVVNNGVNDYSYKESLSNYIFVNGELFVFKGRRSLYKLFPEHKSSLRKFISQKGISMGKSDISDRARLVNYCNSLLNSAE